MNNELIHEINFKMNTLTQNKNIRREDIVYTIKAGLDERS